jgi:AcrR family transcriptional regulator
MPRKRSDTPERIVREAMRLFAQKGYASTSVPEIQAAAGLAPGSGAMYKHYRSKEAVLQVGVEQYVDDARRAQGALHDLTTPPAEALSSIGQMSLEMMAGRYDELRILWRDLEQAPAVHALARREIIQASYSALAEWLHQRAERQEIRVDDSEAVAAVILGSITMFRVFEALWGERTVPIDDERFLRAWHAIVTRGLGLEPPASGRQRRTRRSTARGR